MKTQDEIALERAERLPADQRRLFESFRRLDMRPAAALRATEGRDGTLGSTDRAELLIERFEGLGLSRSAAEVAAIGREGGTLYHLRERLDREPPVQPQLTGLRPSSDELREIRRSSEYHAAYERWKETLPIGAALEAAERECLERRRAERGQSASRPTQLRESAPRTAEPLSEAEDVRVLRSVGFSRDEAVQIVRDGEIREGRS